MKAGDIIKAYGTEWIVLDTAFDNGMGDTGILCLMKDIVKEMPFSNDNNPDYSKSDVAEYLNGLTKEYKNKGTQFLNYGVDLTADDGTGWDRDVYLVSGFFLLTADLYRKYRRYIPNKEDWWWQATAYSLEGGYHSARCVDVDGTINDNYAYYGGIGVSPACVFSFIPEEVDGETYLNDLAKEIGEINKEHGFREVNTKPTDFTALIHSEVSEVLEEFRAGHEATETYYREDGKPEGVPSEIADIIIRCLDMADFYGIDIDAAIAEKIAFNRTRPYLHGKKF